jgi:FkbM family methyltransferase
MNNIDLIHEKISRLSMEQQTAVIRFLDECLDANEKVQWMAGAPEEGARWLSGRIAKNLLGPFVKAVIAETEDEIYAVDPQDTIVGWLLRNNGSFGRSLIRLVKGTLTAQSRLLIVGAHIGTTAVPLSSCCKEVVAIEPNLQSFQLLEFNLHVNQVANCKAHNIAANDKAEYLLFNINRCNTGGSGRKSKAGHHLTTDDTVEAVLPAFPLDDYLLGQKFDVILMDIEGSEYFALKGMQRILASCSSLIVEFFPRHLKEISCVSVHEFLALLPDFQTLTIPSLDKTVGREAFSHTLNYMYDCDMEDDGILFAR